MNSFVNYILKKLKGKSQVIWWGHVKIVLSLYMHMSGPLFFFFLNVFGWLFNLDPNLFFYFILHVMIT